MLDIPNHSSNYNALQHWDIDKGGYEMLAQRDIKCGEDITLSYGISKRFIGFFVYYGFVNPDKSEVKQFLDLTADSPNY